MICVLLYIFVNLCDYMWVYNELTELSNFNWKYNSNSSKWNWTKLNMNFSKQNKSYRDWIKSVDWIVSFLCENVFVGCGVVVVCCSCIAFHESNIILIGFYFQNFSICIADVHIVFEIEFDESNQSAVCGCSCERVDEVLLIKNLFGWLINWFCWYECVREVLPQLYFVFFLKRAFQVYLI